MRIAFIILRNITSFSSKNLFLFAFLSGNLLMVVGGHSDEKIEDKGYVLSLDDSIPVPACLKSICDFPRYFYAATSGAFADGIPTVCGGCTSGSAYECSDDCYKFNYTNTWEPAGTLTYPAGWAGQSEMFHWHIYSGSVSIYTNINHLQRKLLP